MFHKVDLVDQLQQWRKNEKNSAEKLLLQAKSLLKKDPYNNSFILENLSHYNEGFEDLDESFLDENSVFHLSEIKELAIRYRLKFLETNYYKAELPYTAVLKIKDLNQINRKEIKHFKILAPGESFAKAGKEACSLLFAKTNEDNYFLIHQWGEGLPWHRTYLYLPLRKFENLVTSVVLFTLILTLSIPTHLITLDHQASYWSGYRAAAFFHLLIFNFGVTVYFTFTLAKNFSNATWNQYKDFD